MRLGLVCLMVLVFAVVATAQQMYVAVSVLNGVEQNRSGPMTWDKCQETVNAVTSAWARGPQNVNRQIYCEAVYTAPSQNAAPSRPTPPSQAKPADGPHNLVVRELTSPYRTSVIARYNSSAECAKAKDYYNSVYGPQLEKQNQMAMCQRIN